MTILYILVLQKTSFYIQEVKQKFPQVWVGFNGFSDKLATKYDAFLDVKNVLSSRLPFRDQLFQKLFVDWCIYSILLNREHSLM